MFITLVSIIFEKNDFPYIYIYIEKYQVHWSNKTLPKNRGNTLQINMQLVFYLQN